jgi:hypothetical protein
LKPSQIRSDQVSFNSHLPTPKEEQSPGKDVGLRISSLKSTKQILITNNIQKLQRRRRLSRRLSDSQQVLPDLVSQLSVCFVSLSQFDRRRTMINSEYSGQKMTPSIQVN